MTAIPPKPQTTRRILGMTRIRIQQDRVSRVGSCPVTSAATDSSIRVIAGRFVGGVNVATVRDAALTGLSAVRLRLVPVVLVPAAAAVKVNSDSLLPQTLKMRQQI
ncbi:MAG: hypothetical protein Q9196_006745 [Gyalolechia fulgens]